MSNARTIALLSSKSNAPTMRRLHFLRPRFLLAPPGGWWRNQRARREIARKCGAFAP